MFITLLVVGLAFALTAVLLVSTKRHETFEAYRQISGNTVFKSGSREGKAVEAAAKMSTGLDAVVPPVFRSNADPESLGVERRQFLNRSLVTMFGLGLTGFGTASFAFLYPGKTSGFGGIVNVGRIADIQAKIKDGNGFFYVPKGRMWVTEYPATSLEKARDSYGFYSQVQAGLNAGVTALFQTCPHLGCRVPECSTSQWFECPCHGSQYNRVGEKKGGPAPRGMDRFPMDVNADGELVVDTGQIIQGPPVGTNTTGQEAEGPNCVNEKTEH